MVALVIADANLLTGAILGVTELESVDEADVSFAFVTVIVNVYPIPLANVPVTAIVAVCPENVGAVVVYVNVMDGELVMAIAVILEVVPVTVIGILTCVELVTVTVLMVGASGLVK